MSGTLHTPRASVIAVSENSEPTESESAAAAHSLALAQANDQASDLGFGRAAQSTKLTRLITREGDFNVEKHGVGFFESLSLYHLLVTASWPRFLLVASAIDFLVNILFGVLFATLPPGSVAGIFQPSFLGRLAPSFFFSIQTFATIGYGAMSPQSTLSHVFVAAESLASVLVFALITGIVFSRFSRPPKKMRFSSVALFAPFRGNRTFQFRMTNLTKSELLEPRVQVVFSRLETTEGRQMRRYHRLPLFIDHVMFFPLYWTVTHIIDAESPLYGVTLEDLKSSNGEFLVLLTAHDETFAETVYVRKSYRFDEVVFGAKFKDMYVDGSSERVAVDVQRLSDYDLVPLP